MPENLLQGLFTPDDISDVDMSGFEEPQAQQKRGKFTASDVASFVPTEEARTTQQPKQGKFSTDDITSIQTPTSFKRKTQPQFNEDLLNQATNDISQFWELHKDAATAYPLDTDFTRGLRLRKAQDKANEIKNKYGNLVEVGSGGGWPYVKPGQGWGIVDKTPRPESMYLPGKDPKSIKRLESLPKLAAYGGESSNQDQILPGTGGMTQYDVDQSAPKPAEPTLAQLQAMRAAKNWQDYYKEQGAIEDAKHGKFTNVLRHSWFNAVAGVDYGLTKLLAGAARLTNDRDVQEYFDQSVQNALNFRDQYGSDSMVGNFIFSAGDLSVKLAIPGGAGAFAIASALDAYGSGATPQQAIGSGLESLAVVKLAGLTNEIAGRITRPGLQRFAGRTAANAIAPMLVNTIASGQLPELKDLPSSLAFGIVFAAMHPYESIYDLDPNKPLRRVRPVIKEMQDYLVNERGYTPEAANKAVMDAWAAHVEFAKSSGMNPREIRKRAKDFMRDYFSNKETENNQKYEVVQDEPLDPVRKQLSSGASSEESKPVIDIQPINPTASGPVQAVWESIDGDHPVTITGVKGVDPTSKTVFLSVEGSDAGVPSNEVNWQGTIPPSILAQIREAQTKFALAQPSQAPQITEQEPEAVEPQLPGVVYKKSNGNPLEILQQKDNGFLVVRDPNQNNLQYVIHRDKTFVPETINADRVGETVLDKRTNKPMLILASHKNDKLVVKRESGKIDIVHKNQVVEQQQSENLSKETIPETQDTLNAQMQSMIEGRKPAVLIPNETELPEIPDGFESTATPIGIVIHPKSISSNEVIEKAATGGEHELLGYVEPKPQPGEKYVTVAAQDVNDKEIQTAIVSPERAEDQAKIFEQMYPEATVIIGDEQVAKNVLDKRNEERVERRLTPGQAPGGLEQRGYRLAGESPESFYERMKQTTPIERMPSREDYLKSYYESQQHAVGPEPSTADITPIEEGEDKPLPEHVVRESMQKEGMPTLDTEKMQKPETPQQVGIRLRNKYGVHKQVRELMPDISSINEEMKSSGLNPQQQLEAFRSMGVEFQNPAHMIGTIRAVQSELGKQPIVNITYKSGLKNLNYRVLGRFPGGEKILVMTPDGVMKIIQSPYGQTGNTRIRGGATREQLGKVPSIRWQELGLESDPWPTKAEIHRVNPAVDSVLDLTDSEIQENFPEIWKRKQEAEDFIDNAGAANELMRIALSDGSTDDDQEVQESRDRIAKLFNNNMKPDNTSQVLFDTAVVLGNDILKLNQDRNNFDQKLTEKLGDNIKPHLDNVYATLTKPAEMFYSPLERAIKLDLPKRATAQDVKGVLRKSGVSDDEMRWTGFDDFLRDKANKEEFITKQEALDFFQKNKVKLNITTFSDSDHKPLRWSEHQNVSMTTTQDGRTFKIERLENGKYLLMHPYDLKELYNTLEEAKQVVENLNEPVDKTKFKTHTTPGGTNHREITISLPKPKPSSENFATWGRNNGLSDIEITEQWNTMGSKYYEWQNSHGPESYYKYKSSIYEPPSAHKYNVENADVNRIAILRVNDRIGPNNERILHVDEFQDDLQNEIQKLKAEISKYQQVKDRLEKRFRTPEEFDDFIKEKEKELDRLQNLLPFRGKSHELAMKYALGYAIQHGYDTLTWSTGRQVADRYSLAKRVDHIRYEAYPKNGKYYVEAIEGTNIVHSQGNFTPERLVDIFGKEIANQIINGEHSRIDPGFNQFRIIDNKDLSIGGEGKLHLYDKMIPDFMRKYTKKWGGVVEGSRISGNEKDGSLRNSLYIHDDSDGNYIVYPTARAKLSGKYPEGFKKVFRDYEDAKDFIKNQGFFEVHGLSITPQMKASILRSGQNLFGTQESQSNELTDSLMRLKEQQNKKRRNPDIQELELKSNILSKEPINTLKNYSDESKQMIDNATTHLGDQMTTQAVNRASKLGRTKYVLDNSINSWVYYKPNSNRLYLDTNAAEILRLARSNVLNKSADSIHGVAFDVDMSASIAGRLEELRDLTPDTEAKALVTDIVSALDDSINRGEPLTVVVPESAQREGLSTTTVAKHEGLHAADYKLKNAANGIIRDKKAVEKLPHLEQLSEDLGVKGYSQHPQTVAMEAAARILTGDTTDLTLSEEQQDEFMVGYLELTAATYGADQLDEYKNVTTKAREVINEIQEHRRNFANYIDRLVENATNVGDFSQRRRSRGKEGTSEVAQRTTGQNLERKIDDSYNNLDKKISDGSLGRNSAEDTYHITVVTGYELLKANPKLSKEDWNKQVIKELGERARPHLNTVHDLITGKAPTFYSPLENRIRRDFPNKLSVEQACGMLKGVSEDELKFSGINDLLKEKEKNNEKITKQDLLDYLSTNNVKVNVITSGNTLKPLEWFASGMGEQFAHRSTDQIGNKYEIKKIKNNRYKLEIYDTQNHLIDESVQDSLEAAHGVAESMRLDKKDPKELVADEIKRLEDAGYRIDSVDPHRYSDQVYFSDPEGDLISVRELPKELKEDGARIEEVLGLEKESDTRYSEYKLEGGEPNSYVEIKIQIPTGKKLELPKDWKVEESENGTWLVTDSEGKKRGFGNTREDVILATAQHGHFQSQDIYQSPHWDEENVLAHIRGDEREHTDGIEGFVIDEAQSDYATDVRRKGLRGDPLNESERREWLELETLPEKVRTREQQSRLEELDKRKGLKGEVVQLPLLKQWPQLVVKQSIRHAIDRGLSRVSILPARVHIDRWGTERAVWIPTFALVNDRNEILGRYDTKESAETAIESDKKSGYSSAFTDRIENGWKFSFKPQEGGNAGGVDLEQEGLARNLLSKESSIIVRSKEDVLREIKKSYAVQHPEQLADKIWAKMQKEDSGISWPRAEGQLAAYGDTTEYIKQRFPNRPDLLKYAWDREDGKASEAIMMIAFRDVAKPFNARTSVRLIGEEPDRFQYQDEVADNGVPGFSLNINPQMQHAAIHTGQSLYGSNTDDPSYVLDAQLRQNALGKRNIIDQGIITGYETYKTEKEFEPWAKELVKQLGNQIKPHLESIYSRLKEAENLSKEVPDELERKGIYSKKDEKRRKKVAEKARKEATSSSGEKPQLKFTQWGKLFKAEDGAGTGMESTPLELERKSNQDDEETRQRISDLFDQLIANPPEQNEAPKVKGKSYSERVQIDGYLYNMEKEMQGYKDRGEEVPPNLIKTYNQLKIDRDLSATPSTLGGDGGKEPPPNKRRPYWMDYAEENEPDAFENLSGKDLTRFDRIRSRLSNLDFIGTYERRGGDLGREASELIRQAQVDIGNNVISGEAAVKDLRKYTAPIISAFRFGGKPGLAEMLEDHIEAIATGKGYRSNLTRLLKKINYYRLLRFNVKSTVLNMLQPLSTLWPHVSTKEFVELMVEARKPSVRKALLEKVDKETGIKVETGESLIENATPTSKVKAFTDKWFNWFGRASDTNRLMGYLHGKREAERLGLSAEKSERLAADWAKKVEFDNSVYDAIPLFEGDIASVLAQFKGFTVKNIESVINDLRKHKEDTLGGYAARAGKRVLSQIALGGVKSIPGVKALAGLLILGGLAKLLESVFDEDTANTIAEAVYYGAPSLIGEDISSSMVLIDPPYGDTPYEQTVNFLGGPTLSGMLNLYTKTKEGDFIGAIKSSTPYYRMGESVADLATHGKSTYPAPGKREIELNTFETAMRALGFTPVKQSRFYEGRGVLDLQSNLAASLGLAKSKADIPSQLEWEMIDKFRKRYEDEPLREDDKVRIETEEQIANDVRSGNNKDANKKFDKAIADGILSDSATDRIKKKASMSQLAYRVSNMNLEDSIDWFLNKKITREERVELSPILAEKYEAWSKQRREDEQHREAFKSVSRIEQDRINSKMQKAFDLGIREMYKEYQDKQKSKAKP